MGLRDIGLLDFASLAFFAACWIGYALYADIRRIGKNSLMARMHQQRVLWLTQMLKRENRIVDVQVVQVLVQNVAFFASSTILIVGGAVAMLGAGDAAMAVVDELPFAAPVSPVLWDLKVILMIVIFTYAFFKFTWSLRQFNYVATLIGAAPPHTEAPDEAYARRVALLASRAADHFNRAMRAYYFGLAALAWFIQPWLLIGASILVLIVVWRREYRSYVVALLDGR